MADLNWNLLNPQTQMNPVGYLIEGQEARARRDDLALRRSREARAVALQEQELAREQAGREAVATYAKDPAKGREMAGATGDADLLAKIGQMDDAQRQRFAEMNQLAAVKAYAYKALPLEQRAAALQKDAPDLMKFGFTEDQLKAIDLSDEGLEKALQGSLTAAQLIQRQNTQADDRRMEESLAEQKRHNREMEALSGGRLDLSRQREGRVAAGGGKKGGAAAGGSDALRAIEAELRRRGKL